MWCVQVRSRLACKTCPRVWFGVPAQHFCGSHRVLDDRRRRVSAVEPGSTLWFVYTPDRQWELFVCQGSWHLGCHYPVSALIKWVAHRRERGVYKDARLSSEHTHIHTHKRLSLSSPDTFLLPQMYTCWQLLRWISISASELRSHRRSRCPRFALQCGKRISWVLLN